MAQKNQGLIIVAGLRTSFIQARAAAQPQALGKGRCVAVVIQNRLTNIDQTANNSDIMIGTGGGGQLYQMLPGQESPIIYCDDLEEVYMRLRDPAGTACDVPVFIYSEKGS